MGVTGIAPAVDIPTYRLTITGRVEKPLSLTYQDLLAYPSMTEIVVVECPGFFRDIAEWTGVSLNTILAEAGITSGASQVALSAVDGYRQELSLEHVDEYGVFLAYKVNGQTLPPEHGFPLRVVDKGSLGAKWVKWLANIEVR
jgi:DMSO/TMAO reductase YedYZ molybdopterin-dependent catalytic subunit